MTDDPLLAEKRRRQIAAARSQVESTEPIVQQGPTRQPFVAPDAFPGYEVARVIHRGGQGVVFEAVQTSTKRRVALKVLHEGLLAGHHDRVRFEREVYILAQLKHPNIVSIHDSGQIHGCLFFVMDYIDGWPLDVDARIRSSSIRERLVLFRKITEAVNAAHIRGIIHRDLKPSNMLIDEQGEPYVLDFGLAKLFSPGLEPGGHQSVQTTTGQFVGSLPWSSPEQVAGRPDDVDMRTDVYSLGVMLYHALTGQFPYPVSGSVRDVVDRILTAEPVRPSRIVRQIDHEVETIVLKCLQKDRTSRYQNAGELARDIHRYLNHEAIEAKRDNSWYWLKKTVRRHRLPVGIVVALVLAGTAFGLVFTGLHRRAVSAELATSDVSRDLGDLLVKLMYAMGRREGETTDLRRTLDDAARLADQFADRPDIAGAIHHIVGVVHGNLGNQTEAETHMNRAVALTQHLDRPPPGWGAESRVARGQILRERDEFVEAERLLREGHEQLRGVYGLRHARVLAATFQLAVLYEYVGKLDEAESLLHETLLVQREVLGHLHWDTLMTMKGLAWVLTLRGSVEEANRLSREALDGFLHRFGEVSTETFSAMSIHASVLLARGQPHEAERLYRMVLEKRRKKLGFCNPSTLVSIDNLASLYHRVARFDQAESLFQELLAADRESPVRPTLRSRFRTHYAALLTDLQRFEEAEPLLLAAWTGYPDALEPDHPNVKETLHALVALYDAWAKPHQAAQWRAKLPAAYSPPP
jgi:tetratricopeptide (TPR) repeat protein/tRNA A-37 threonylcarbamoyl transferase component Bud32